MKKYNQLAFSDFIAGTSNVYSTTDLYDMLAGADQIAIIGVVDQCSGGGTLTFTVQIEHSGDGINWISKNAAAEINNASMALNTTSVAYGSDAGTTPTQRLVRLRLALNASVGVPAAHLKVYVCGRDKGRGRSPSSLLMTPPPSIAPMNTTNPFKPGSFNAGPTPPNQGAARVDAAGRPLP